MDPPGVKSLAKRLRRRREPSISGLQRHSTFAGDLGDPRPSMSLNDLHRGLEPEEEEEEGAYDSDPEISSTGISRQGATRTKLRPQKSNSSLSHNHHHDSHNDLPPGGPLEKAESFYAPDFDRPSRSRTRQVDTPSISVSPAGGRFRDIFSKKPANKHNSSDSAKHTSSGSAGSLAGGLTRSGAHIVRSRPSSVDQSRSRTRSNLADELTLKPPSALDSGAESDTTGEIDTPTSLSSSLGTVFASAFDDTAAPILAADPIPSTTPTDSTTTPTIVTPTASTPTENPAPSFFSSIVSVAQTAATSFTTIIPANQRPRTSDDDMDKDSAVRTLGSGDLSLSQLGLADPSESGSTPMVLPPRIVDPNDNRPRSEPAADSVPPASIGDLGSEDITSVARARTFHDPSSNTIVLNELSSPAGSVYGDKAHTLGRSGSVKSAVSRRRNRGSSNTTGVPSSRASASASASASAVNLAAPPALSGTAAPAGGPRLTGFAIASKKRNRDFHTLFKSVPDDDYLIEDYSCAIQREILAHGRMYVSEGHLCFSSNIFGWVTTLVMSFGEIVSVEKRSTALLFKNGLMITTLHAKHVFASFTSRDATYDLIVNIWKLGHPSLQSSLNGIRLEGTGGDKTEKIDMPGADGGGDEAAPGGGGGGSEDDEDDDESEIEGDEEEDEDDVYDEDEEHAGGGGGDVAATATTQAADASAGEAPEVDRTVSRKPSGTTANPGATPEQPAEAFPAAAAAGASAAPTANDFPGPATHAPTECGDAATHYDRPVADEIIPAPLGQVYNKLFGPGSVAWMSKWLQGEQKCTDFQMEDKKGLTSDNKTRTFSYIKPLNAPLGPKSTKCIVTETVDALDLEKAVSISCSTLTPDVPSGNVFSTKTRYCLTWAADNSTRFQASCTVEWTGKSWIKGPIEKGCNDGQIQYCKELVATLRSAVARPRSSTGGGGGAKGKGRRKAGRKAPQSSTDVVDATTTQNKRVVQTADWGVLEPVRPVLEPVVDIFKPLLSANVLYGVLLGLLIAWWFGYGSSSPPSKGSCDYPSLTAATPDRVAAYEAMWRREESDLWDWLQARVGGVDALGNRVLSPGEQRMWNERVRSETMAGREMDEAIRIAEERIRVLRGVIARRSAL